MCDGHWADADVRCYSSCESTAVTSEKGLCACTSFISRAAIAGATWFSELCTSKRPSFAERSISSLHNRDSIKVPNQLTSEVDDHPVLLLQLLPGSCRLL